MVDDGRRRSESSNEMDLEGDVSPGFERGDSDRSEVMGMPFADALLWLKNFCRPSFLQSCPADVLDSDLLAYRLLYYRNVVPKYRSVARH